MELFFVSCPIGFERDLERELKEFWPYLIHVNSRPHSFPLELLKMEEGGILLRCPMVLGLQINYFSKIAHRVLLRIGEWEVTSFSRLFERFKSVREKIFSILGISENGAQRSTSPVHFSVYYKIQAQKSRLNNEKRILELAVKAIGTQKEVPPHSNAIYIRMFEDLCTLSLDTTGEHLHFRGWRTHQGIAPLRETLAAWGIRKMIQDIPSLKDLHSFEWVDPMCGSGTFLMEALQLYSPSCLRSFSFENWKCTPPILKSKHKWGNYQFPNNTFQRYWGFDVQEKMIFQNQKLLPHFDKKISPCEFSVKDYWKISTFPFHENRLVIMNPPYGERIKRNFTLKELIDHGLQVFSPSKLGVFFPQSHQIPYKTNGNRKEYSFQFKRSEGLDPEIRTYSVRKYPLLLGGIPGYFWILKKERKVKSKIKIRA